MQIDRDFFLDAEGNKMPSKSDLWLGEQNFRNLNIVF